MKRVKESRKKLYIICIALMITSLLPGLQLKWSKAKSEIRASYSDLVYASLSNKEKLDLYIPTSGMDTYPVIIWIHGGAFLMGDKAAANEVSMINKLVARGFAVASINYRFSSEAIYPAQIKDCKAAVRFLRANAAQYHLNTNQFISWGGSAGGCLSSLLGTTGAVEELEGPELGNPEYSSRVNVSIDWFGPIEFLTMDEQAAAQGFTINTNAASSPESRLIGAPIQTVPVLTNKANALQYVTSDDAVMVCQHGTSDTNIPILQSFNLYSAISETLGQDNALYTLIQGAGHGGSLFETDENVDLVVSFINSHLGPLSADNEVQQASPVIKNISNYPNPFNPSTMIRFELTKREKINVSIYNLKGQKINQVFSDSLNAGQHQIEWNGLDSKAKKCPSGVYFYRIDSNSSSVTNKMMLMK